MKLIQKLKRIILEIDESIRRNVLILTLILLKKFVNQAIKHIKHYYKLILVLLLIMALITYSK